MKIEGNLLANLGAIPQKHPSDAPGSGEKAGSSVFRLEENTLTGTRSNYS
jgi:hypothetical protein